MKIFYGTFKFQSHLRDYYVKIECRTLREAHNLMHQYYESDWSNVYPEIDINLDYYPKGELNFLS